MDPLLVLIVILPVTAAMKPRVNCMSSSPAFLGGDVTLTCDFPYPMNVLQVTWEKRRRGSSRETILTHSKEYGVNIAKPYGPVIEVLQANSTRSSITISKLEEEDQACYICLFNTYPDGAFPGEVCLENLAPSNEVTCWVRGKRLNVTLTPPEIQSRRSGQLVKSAAEGTSVLKGRYMSGSIRPLCTFRMHGASRRSRGVQENNLTEGRKEIIITQCIASGTQIPSITWDNEKYMISKEEKVNTTNNIITLTSTLHHLVSSLSTDFRVSCNVSHRDPAEYPSIVSGENVLLDNEGGAQFAKVQLQENMYSVTTRIGIVFVAAMLMILILAFIKFRRNKESASPPESPQMRSLSRKPNTTSEDDYHVKLNETTPISHTDRSPPQSSVRKRKEIAVKVNNDNVKRKLFDTEVSSP